MKQVAFPQLFQLVQFLKADLFISLSSIVFSFSPLPVAHPPPPDAKPVFNKRKKQGGGHCISSHSSYSLTLLTFCISWKLGSSSTNISQQCRLLTRFLPSLLLISLLKEPRNGSGVVYQLLIRSPTNYPTLFVCDRPNFCLDWFLSFSFLRAVLLSFFFITTKVILLVCLFAGGIGWFLRKTKERKNKWSSQAKPLKWFFFLFLFHGTLPLFFTATIISCQNDTKLRSLKTKFENLRTRNAEAQ